MKSISNKRGFTLIELLAVIVILAIIALIAVPIVLNIIEKARKGAVKTSTLNYIKAVETYLVASKLDKDALELKKGESYNCTKNTIIGEKNYLAINDLVEIKGYKPTGSNDQITIDENNQVEAGNLTINGYTVEIKNREVSSIVKGAKIDVESISLNYSNQTMEKGSTFKLVPIFTPKDASDQRVTYTSSDTSVASVSDDGIVTAVNNGTTKITVTSKGDTSKKAECNITVITSATGVSIEPTTKEINIGGTVQLTGTIQPGDVTTNALEWTSSNESITHVDENGLVTGMGVGTATIKARTVNGKEATSTITVKAIEAESVGLNKTSVTIAAGGTLQLVATVSPNNATDKSLTWSSSNTSVATVSNSGVVTGKSGGSATITVKTSNNKTATSTITVIEGPTKVAAQEGETHKGIVYLDPTNLNKACTKTEADANINSFNRHDDNTISTASSGCLKWYIYNDSGSNYKMILDHNIRNAQWATTDNLTLTYENSGVKAAMDKYLADWKVTPDLITTSEISTITGKTDFDKTNKDTWYYFDSKTQTQTANASTKSKYDWLYNNNLGCQNYGCTENIYPNVNSRYWTRDKKTGSGSIIVWVVYGYGYLYTQSTSSSFAIRPVITISKSQLS